VLLDWEGHLKLTDLGLCKKVEVGNLGSKAAQVRPCPAYLALIYSPIYSPM
jgi:hypothetical protein